MKRSLYFVYGVTAHVIFFFVYAYLIGFVTGFLTPTTLDGPRAATPLAALVDILLIAAFGIQHSVMARPAFKRWWTQFIPTAIERATYVMVSNAIMIAMFLLWQPLPLTVWQVQNQSVRCALWALAAAGWMLVPAASFLINHFDLFGTRQVWLYLKGRAYSQPPFRMPLLYRIVRHPLYVGWLMAFWITPTMSAGHLLFASGMTAYILIAIRFEERDLARVHGAEYSEYRKRVPMLIPIWPVSKPAGQSTPQIAAGE